MEGVRQDSVEGLARSLTALARIHDRHPLETRRLVLTAKEHARLLGRSEMVQWMIVWLENPGIFETWMKAKLARVYCKSIEST